MLVMEQFVARLFCVVWKGGWIGGNADRERILRVQHKAVAPIKSVTLYHLIFVALM